MMQIRTRIRFNEPAGGGCRRMGLDAPEDFGKARPGQFVTLRLVDGTGPLLRRPFSIHGLIWEAGAVAGIELLFKVVGGFTRRLSEMGPGRIIDLLGPLGNDFDVPDSAQRIWMIAGGIGVAPLVFLARSLADKGADLAACALFIGGRTADDLLCLDRFSELGVPIHAATEDGTAGETGLVTQPLARAAAVTTPDILCACGPMPMLRAVAEIGAAHHIPSRVSMETLMACGLGACLGCAVETAGDENGYRHVCRDGPVFNGRWLRKGSSSPAILH
jgi:dihydroorotate dehydrogenase electron transfer subunit